MREKETPMWAYMCLAVGSTLLTLSIYHYLTL